MPIDWDQVLAQARDIDLNRDWHGVVGQRLAQ